MYEFRVVTSGLDHESFSDEGMVVALQGDSSLPIVGEILGISMLNMSVSMSHCCACLNCDIQLEATVDMQSQKIGMHRLIHVRTRVGGMRLACFFVVY